MTTPPPLHVAGAAGFSGDRTDAAGPLVEALVAAGGPGVLIFETLAERTLALAQLARQADPEAGYEPLLDELLRPVLGQCLAHGIRIVSNFGAAHPEAAARHILRLAAELGLPAPAVAVVLGDVVDLATGQALLAQAAPAVQTQTVVSANVYQGAQGIAAALRAGAQVVVCGRVADPALVLGPAMAHFGWASDDWDRLARATMAGHLLECGAQVSGGYFADPGLKDVPDLARLGYPLAEIDAEGHCTLSKPAGSGGRLDRHTVLEQLLYEVHDPAAYLTPDVVADLSQAELTELGPDRVRLTGVRGHPCPPTLKVNVCHANGWLAEGEISYAGSGAQARARLAAQVLQQRLADLGRLRADLIGVCSVLADDAGQTLAELLHPIDGGATDVRLRVALAHADRRQAERLCREVTALYTCGPAGGGGVRTSLRSRLGTVSGLLPREDWPQRWAWMDAVSGQLQTAQPVAPVRWEAAPWPQPSGGETLVGPDHLWCAGQALSAPAVVERPGGAWVPLEQLAHARTGDKGNRSNISVIAWHPALWPVLLAQVGAAQVAWQFRHRRPTAVQRHVLPQWQAMNFVLDDALDGGVNDALNLDSHGKALAFGLLAMQVWVPDALLPCLRHRA